MPVLGLLCHILRFCVSVGFQPNSHCFKDCPGTHGGGHLNCFLVLTLPFLPCAVYISILEVYFVFASHSIQTNIPYLIILPGF
jgi:hypothetical protein